MENNTVKLPTLILLITILTGVVSGALLWVRNDLSKMDNRIWEMQENLAKIPAIEEKLNDLVKQVNEGRKKTGDSSFNLIDLLRIND